MLRQAVLTPQLRQLVLLRARQRIQRTLAAGDLGLLHPLVQHRLPQVQVTRHLGHRASLLQNKAHRPGLELFRERPPPPVQLLARHGHHVLRSEGVHRTGSISKSSGVGLQDDLTDDVVRRVLLSVQDRPQPESSER